MTTAQELLTQTDHLLLDFDGPITRLLPPPANVELTDQLRQHALDMCITLNPDEMSTTDHLAIIRAARRHGLASLLAIEHEATCLEIAAAAVSPLTPGVRELLRNTQENGARTSVITNNSPDCVEAFLRRQDLRTYVGSIHGRDGNHIEHMKPNPWMLLTALEGSMSSSPVMLGDSVSDIIAAQSIKIPSIGLAKNTQRASELRLAGAAAVVCDMTLTSA